MVAACKPHGIKSITYGKHVAMNNEGWELVRRHPDWFYMDDKGRPCGSFVTSPLMWPSLRASEACPARRLFCLTETLVA